MHKVTEATYCNKIIEIYTPYPTGNRFAKERHEKDFLIAANALANSINSAHKFKNQLKEVEAAIERFALNFEKLLLKHQPHYQVRYTRARTDKSVKVFLETIDRGPDYEYREGDQDVSLLRSSFYAPVTLLVKSECERGKLGYLPKWFVDRALLELADRGLYKRQRFARYPKNPPACPSPIIKQLRQIHLNQLNH